MFNREEFFRNLNDDSINVFEFQNGNEHYTIMKRKFSKGLTFLYFSSYYGKRTPQTREDYFSDMRFGGVWNGDKVYFPEYNIRIMLEADYVSLYEYKSELAEAARNRAIQLIGDAPVSASKDSNALSEWVTVQSYIDNQLDRDATSRFITGEYVCHYHCNGIEDYITQLDMINTIGDYDAAVDNIAKRCIDFNANYINYWVETESLCREKIQEFENDPPTELLLRKRIYNAVNDLECNAVTVVFKCGDHCIESKIGKTYLTSLSHCNWISSWNLDAKARQKFERAKREVGKSTDLRPGDIMEIRFRRKTIYKMEV